MPKKKHGIVHASLIKRINESHELTIKAGQSMAEYAVQTGRLLAEAKDAVGHGNWQAWLVENCPAISTRTARLYIQKSEEWACLDESKRQRVAILPLRQRWVLEPEAPQKTAVSATKTAIPDTDGDQDVVVEPTPSQAKALERLPEPDRFEAWERVVERAPIDDKAGQVKITVKAVQEVVEEMMPTATLPPGTTDDGQRLTPHVVAALLEAVHYTAAITAIDHAKRAVKSVGELKSARFLHTQDIMGDLDNARRGVKFAMPHGPCPYCAQAGCAPGKGCRKAGWLPLGMFKEAKRAVEG